MAVVSKSAKKNTILSRPVIYTLVAAVAVYAYVLNTTPPTPTGHKIKHFTHESRSTNDGGITEQDLTAHFNRYVGGAKDPFVPAVALRAAESPADTNGSGGKWSLTGINTVDGVTTANIESTNGDSIFLKVGDTWNGLKVTAIKADSVDFVNSLGQPTSLSFPGNDLAGASGSTADAAVASSAPAPSAPPLPNFKLSPMPVPGPPGDGANAADQGGNNRNQDNNTQ